MKVLFAVSECIPFVKTGGLADVAGSLPKELKELGTDIRVILPKYKTIQEKYQEQLTMVTKFTVMVGWRKQYCGIEALTQDGIIYYFIDNQYYFGREEIYGYPDDGERFAFFNRAVLEAIDHLSFYPEVIHCHDWHTGMIPFLHKTDYQKRFGYEQIRTVFTIHNLQFQGIFPKEVLGELFNVSESYLNSDQLEFYGNMSFMKGALTAADQITTVSPSYMDEIQTEYFGEKLEGVLQQRRSDLEGILNGIDYHFYNPESDPFINHRYGLKKLKGKLKNKASLQKELDLPVEDVPVIAMITRLTKQKGLELVTCVFEEMMRENLQMIVLGTGDEEYENFFKEMSRQYPDKFKAIIGFNEKIAHKIYAASDLFLMPSKFEPCGLSQMIAMRYGSVPIVRETGGLKDSVQPYNQYTKQGNGFSFANFNAHEMLNAIERALGFYQTEDWDKLIASAMKADFSWRQSATKYNDLYSRVISRSESHVF